MATKHMGQVVAAAVACINFTRGIVSHEGETSVTLTALFAAATQSI